MSSGAAKNNVNLLFEQDENKIELFLNTFTINYWYIFLFWIFSLNELTVFISYAILLLKCSVFGILFCMLVKANALFGVGLFFVKIFGQMFFILSIMYFILLSKSMNKNKLILSTIVLAIYCILNSLI